MIGSSFQLNIFGREGHLSRDFSFFHIYIFGRGPFNCKIPSFLSIQLPFLFLALGGVHKRKYHILLLRYDYR